MVGIMCVSHTRQDRLSVEEHQMLIKCPIHEVTFTQRCVKCHIHIHIHQVKSDWICNSMWWHFSRVIWQLFDTIKRTQYWTCGKHCDYDRMKHNYWGESLFTLLIFSNSLHSQACLASTPSDNRCYTAEAERGSHLILAFTTNFLWDKIGLEHCLHITQKI